MEDNKEKTFREKMKDSKYKAKVQLSAYGVFLLIVIIFLLLSGGFNKNESDNEVLPPVIEEDKEIEVEPEEIFKKPDTDNYSYKIELLEKSTDSENIYYFYGKVLSGYQEIEKIVNDKKETFRIKDNKYFILNNDKYVLTTKDNLYDVIDYNYIDIDNINNYLKQGQEVEGENVIYLKDIILDADTDSYITYILEKDLLKIDYTNLINYLLETDYIKYIVTIEYIK